MLTKTVPLPYPIAKNPKFQTFEAQQNSGTKSVFSIVPYLTANSQLIIFENSIKFYSGNQNSCKTTPPIRTKKDIKGFSKKSRKNLFDLFNTINYTTYGIPLFISLTWHFDDPDNKKSLKTFIDKYLKRLKRSLPPFHYIWKFEFQKRGTPHFHIIIFPLEKENNFNNEKLKSDISNHWLKLKQCKCSDCKKFSVKTIVLETIEKSISYISKEIAKVCEKYIDSDVGRYWSASQNIRTSPIDIIPISLPQFNTLVQRATKILNERIILAEKNKSKKIESLLTSKNYIESLNNTSNNATIFIAYKNIIDLLTTFETERKNL